MGGRICSRRVNVASSPKPFLPERAHIRSHQRPDHTTGPSATTYTPHRTFQTVSTVLHPSFMSAPQGWELHPERGSQADRRRFGLSRTATVMSAVPIEVHSSEGERLGRFSIVPPAPPSSMEALAREVAVALGIEDETNRFEDLFSGPLEDLKEGRQLVSTESLGSSTILTLTHSRAHKLPYQIVGRLRWLTKLETRQFEVGHHPPRGLQT